MVFGHLVLLFFSCLFFPLSITFGLCFDSFQLFMIASLQHLQLLYFVHSLIKHFSFLQYFISLFLQFFILFYHPFSFSIQLLVLLSYFFCFSLLLLQLLFCLVSLSLQHFSFMHYPQIFFSFSLNLPFMLFQLLFFFDKFFSFSIEFLSLSFVSSDVVVSEANAFHICSYHFRDAISLLRTVLLQPTAYNIEQPLHLLFIKFITVQASKIESTLLTTWVAQSLPVQTLIFFFSLHQNLPKQLLEIVIVWLFLELQTLYIFKIFKEHQGIFTIGFDEFVNSRNFFKSANLSILLCLRMNLNALPRKFTNQKIQKQVSQRLQVISSTLLISLMRSNTGISRSSYKTFTPFDRNVLPCFEISVSFCQPKIYDIDSPFIFSTASHKVVSFDISMDKSFSMYLLQTRNDLYPNLESSCQGKVFLTKSTILYQI